MGRKKKNQPAKEEIENVSVIENEDGTFEALPNKYKQRLINAQKKRDERKARRAAKA
jgi:hypothetical protein